MASYSVDHTVSAHHEPESSLWPALAGGHPWIATQQVGELLYLREHYLSHRLLDDYDVIVDACYQAGNQLTSECIRSLCNYPFSEVPQPLAAPLLPW